MTNYHFLMFLDLKFLNFWVKTSFERSFTVFINLKRHSEVSRPSDQGLGTDDVYPATHKLHI